MIDGRFDLKLASVRKDYRKVEPINCDHDLPKREKNEHKEYYAYAGHEDYLVKGVLITYNKYGNVVVYEATKHTGKYV